MVGGEAGKCVSIFLVVKRAVCEYVPSCRARRARQSSPLERMRAFRQTASSNMGRNRTPTLADFVAANYTRDAIALAPAPRDVRPKCNPHPLRTEGKEGDRRFSTVAPRFDVPGGPASLAESGHQRHPLTRLLGPRPGSSWGSVHRSYVRQHSSADGVLRPACGHKCGEPTSPADAVRPSSAYERAAERCGGGTRAYT